MFYLYRFVIYIYLRYKGTVLQDSLQELKSEYNKYEDIAFGKMKGLFEATVLLHVNKLIEF